MLAERKKFAHLRERPGPARIKGGLLGWLTRQKIEGETHFQFYWFEALFPVEHGRNNTARTVEMR